MDGEDLVEQLEFLLGHLLVCIVDRNAVELIDVLEPVNHKRLQSPSVEHFVVVNVQRVKRLDALDFT